MATDADGRRFPPRVYGQGVEPDARFTLANERTFLAWIRTSLALVAGGVALEALGLPLHPTLRVAASVTLLVLGLVTPTMAWVHWAAVEAAVRRGTPLPAPRLGLPLAAGSGRRPPRARRRDRRACPVSFDPGLRPERTALSWDRTSLSLIAGGLVAGRVLPPALGRWALAAGIATGTAGVALGLIAHRRARRRLRVLLGASGVLPDGRLPLALAVVVAGVAGGALVAIVLLRAGG